ncbi:MAG: radical SAM protein [Magnetococcales bacterium]|nr:radical SAM protein [Magnetococcales bacterium]
MASRLKRALKKKQSRTQCSLHPSWPKQIQLEVANSCNQDCLFCFINTMKRSKKRMDLEFGRRIMTEAYEEGSRVISFAAGAEPLMHPNLDAFIRIAKQELNYDYVFLTTNGMVTQKKLSRWDQFIEAGLESVKISINAGDRETYKKVHRRDHFDQVIASIKHLSKLKKKYDFFLGVSSVSLPQNEESITHLEPLIGHLVDEVLVVPADNQSGQMIEYDTFISENCKLPFTRIYVTAEGYLRMCCGDMENFLAVEDLNQMSLKEAFYSERTTEFRRRHLEKNLEGTLCYRCLNSVQDPIEPLNPDIADRWSHSIEIISKSA